MTLNMLLNTITPHEVLRIVEINFSDGDTIGGNCIAIIGNALGYPMMPASDLHVPDLMRISKQDRITSSAAIAFDKFAQIANSLTRA